MIYVIFPEIVQQIYRKPELAVFHIELHKIGFKDKANADSIFELKNGKTIYYKHRYQDPRGPGYQYTEDEQLMLRLKAVPL